MLQKLNILIILIAMLAACGSSGNEPNLEDEFEDQLTNEAGKEDEPVPEVSEVAMEEIVQNISSPVEMAALIKEVGVPFSLDYLSSTDNPDRYNTNFKKAIALGYMGADLGYLNIYNKTAQIIGYITLIKKLADGLKVGQFFDFQTLKRLASNNENLDSLMYISVNSFNQMDAYLRDTRRSDLSALIVTGVWMEGMYLATQVIKEKPNKDISERIGEQKVILNELILILEHFKKDENFAKLIVDFEQIRSAFEGIEITYKLGEPLTKEEDGNTIIIQTEESIVKITPEQQNKIIDVIEKKRNKYSSL
jgi:hypothetical protein